MAITRMPTAPEIPAGVVTNAIRYAATRATTSQDGDNSTALAGAVSARG
jgi:hypothetical protein